MTNRLFPLLTLLLSIAPWANAYVGVDLRDLVQYGADVVPEADCLFKALQDPRNAAFPPGVRLPDAGVAAPRDGQRNVVFGIELQELPQRNDVVARFRLVGFYHSDQNGYVFRSLMVDLDRRTLEAKVYSIQEVALVDTEFAIRVSLVERKVVLEDQTHGFAKVYPLDVGGFDEGVTASSQGRIRLKTPVFKNPTIRKDHLIMARPVPRYFWNRPFVRIAEAGEWTPIGFHINQGQGIRRGFESHGCLRLREKDLFELATILQKGQLDYLSLSMNLEMDPKSPEHPMPKWEKSYMTVANVGSATSPRPTRGADGLTVMVRRRAAPPTEKLLGKNEGPALASK